MIGRATRRFTTVDLPGSTCIFFARLAAIAGASLLATGLSRWNAEIVVVAPHAGPRASARGRLLQRYAI
jgi:hypothetical protein